MENSVEVIVEKLKHIKGRNKEEEIEECKRRIRGFEEDVERGKRHINKYYQKINEEMKRIRVYEIQETEEDDFTTDVKALLEHPSVINVEVYEKIVYVYTDYIDIFDEEGRRFKGNKYKIKLDFNSMGVKIFGEDENYCRTSCWTEGDPHPHVNGGSGVACLGDAGSMLSISMNEYEIYASYIITYNFLQQVNTDDYAGKYVENWDCVDEENNIIENPHKRIKYKCSCCNRELLEDDDEIQECDECGEVVCSECYMWVSSVNMAVCDGCREDSYSYCESCDETYPDDKVEEIDGTYYCDECREEYCAVCEVCGETHKKGNMKEYEGEYYCVDCYNEKYDICTDCETTHEIEELVACNNCGSLYCEDCYGEKCIVCNEMPNAETEGAE